MEVPRLADDAYGPLGRVAARVSRIGFGCYRVDDRVAEHRRALRAALLAGVTLFDTSTNYADGHSETLLGEVLADGFERGVVRREDVVVVTKAGYLQGSNLAEARRRAREGRPFREVVEYGEDLQHSISPDFLEEQLSASLERLRLPRVDVLLLHNPEYFLTDALHRGVARDEARAVFEGRAARAFRYLEAEVRAGRIGAYGVSSNTFVVPHESAEAVSLPRLLGLAGPGFALVQLPFNPIETGAREPIHTEGGKSVLDVARAAGLGVLVNRPFNAFSRGGLVRFAELPPEGVARLGRDAAWESARVAELSKWLTAGFGSEDGGTLSQRTLRALGATPGVGVVLVGMRRPAYVRDAVGAFPAP
jgi:aryl-alcohol dehydrogenase-like predicted oxidoreductase